MGCDIHCFVEVRDKNRKWKKATGFISDYYNASDSYFSKKEYKNSDNILMERNYWEFAILADVRNGVGFAGCDMGDRIEPISIPKGIPDDISEEIKQEIDEWGEDGHSHSYLTAKEISEYDTNTSITNRGYVNCKQYKEFLDGKLPTMWSGYVDGHNVIEVVNDDCIRTQKEHPELRIYTQIEWKEPAKTLASFLFGNCLKQLMSRSKNKTGDDVRLVFWFDN